MTTTRRELRDALRALTAEVERLLHNGEADGYFDDQDDLSKTPLADAQAILARKQVVAYKLTDANGFGEVWRPSPEGWTLAECKAEAHRRHRQDGGRLTRLVTW